MATSADTYTCRLCGAGLTTTVVDLGSMPLANAYSRSADEPEQKYPLHVYICESCLLVQLHHDVSPSEIFSDYAYFSSFSTSWLEHAQTYALDAVDRWRLDGASRVVEVASNDGYLLRNFVAAGVPVLGIEPAANVARQAQHDGVPTVIEFLGQESARRLVASGVEADLLIANNVLAHVPDLNDFIAGLSLLLGPSGVLTIEFPHVLRMLEDVQFDTIYHEHFSYFSLCSAEAALARHGMRVFDVQQLQTHGGSLRLMVCHMQDPRPEQPGVTEVRAQEARGGIHDLATYQGFASRVEEVKAGLLDFLVQAERRRETVAAYGAAAKGNTLLNACGVTPRQVPFAVDRNPHKQGLHLPGSRIPVYNPDRIIETRPDYVLILPWNLAAEIVDQLAYIREWGGRFVTAVPDLQIRP